MSQIIYLVFLPACKRVNQKLYKAFFFNKVKVNVTELITADANDENVNDLLHFGAIVLNSTFDDFATIDHGCKTLSQN